VIAARVIPDKLLLSTELGVGLVAVGVEAGGREVLCVLGGTGERADEVAGGLDRSLSPPSREPRSGEPMGNLVRVRRLEGVL
jgi:hypothetical protein